MADPRGRPHVLTARRSGRVASGDTLTGIVRQLRDFGRFTVAQIVAANPKITDPDHIEVGWRLRVPLKR